MTGNRRIPAQLIHAVKTKTEAEILMLDLFYKTQKPKFDQNRTIKKYTNNDNRIFNFPSFFW